VSAFAAAFAATAESTAAFAAAARIRELLDL
jgi:hypothetical protein